MTMYFIPISSVFLNQTNKFKMFLLCPTCNWPPSIWLSIKWAWMIRYRNGSFIWAFLIVGVNTIFSVNFWVKRRNHKASLTSKICHAPYSWNIIFLTFPFLNSMLERNLFFIPIIIPMLKSFCLKRN